MKNNDGHKLESRPYVNFLLFQKPMRNFMKTGKLECLNARKMTKNVNVNTKRSFGANLLEKIFAKIITELVLSIRCHLRSEKTSVSCSEDDCSKYKVPDA